MWAVWGIVQAREDVEGHVVEPEFDYLGYSPQPFQWVPSGNPKIGCICALADDCPCSILDVDY